MKSQDLEAPVVLSSYRAPAPRKVSKIVRNNWKDCFGTSQAPVFTTTIGLIQNSEVDASLDDSEVHCGDCHRLSISESLLRLDEDFHELSYPSQGNAPVDLESFYPAVLNFESGEIVAANGNIHTVMRTTTCELGTVLSSVSVGKSKEPTVSVIRNCLNSKPEARHPGSCKYESRHAIDVVNTELSMHCYDAVVTGDADSFGSSVLVKRTPPSRFPPPLKAVTPYSLEIGENLSRKIGRYDRVISPLQEVSRSADPAQVSVGGAAIHEYEEFYQSCSPPPGVTFMELLSEEVKEFNLVSGAEGKKRSVEEKRCQKQLKENEVNQQQRKSLIPPSEKLGRVHGTIHSVYSNQILSGNSCVGSTKAKSEEDGGEGEEMKNSYDLNSRTCDSMNLTSTAPQLISDSPFQVSLWTPGYCQDISVHTPSMDCTAPEIGLDQGVEKSNSLHVAPQTPAHTNTHTDTKSPTNIRVTIRKLLTALASFETATGNVGNQQTFTPKVAPPSYLSSSFSFSSSPLIAASTELIKQGTKAAFFLFLAVIILLSVRISFSQEKKFPSHPSRASTSPWIGQFNASDVISDRYAPYYLLTSYCSGQAGTFFT
jgi:hypothetical protein